MTSSVSEVIARPLIGAMAMVIAARWWWFNGTTVDRYLNTTLTVILLTQLLRERAVQDMIAGHSPLTVTTIQQLTLCTIVVAVAPFLNGARVLLGENAEPSRRERFCTYATAIGLSILILIAGTRARRERLPLEISGGWDGVAVWVAFSVLPLYVAGYLICRCSVEFRQPGATAAERLVLTGITAVGVTIGATTAIALVLPILQQLNLVDSVGYRLATNSRNFFWIAVTITAISAVTLVQSIAGWFGFDSTTRRWKRLRPLWRALVSLFPDSLLPLDSSETTRRITRLRLHRMTVEIRDAVLQLHPYLRDVDPMQLETFIAAEHIPHQKQEAARFALQLAYAVRDKADFPEHVHETVCPLPPSTSANLEDEVTELLQLAEWWSAARRFATADRHPAPNVSSVESNP
ncbi:MAB_1171c family putative transporter [Nocardia transvalensis]|uniref:MAB_1171c family putative transporter n=1 Tax=Nocardia transvalensis TaxID=37333 RepID=UPI0018949916|nr:MAB_1171c family putative transporter [Nocardia transvalensis]MBF6332326.1 hypothetical protein [Nocardia transvalensis]